MAPKRKISHGGVLHELNITKEIDDSAIVKILYKKYILGQYFHTISIIIATEYIIHNSMITIVFLLLLLLFVVIPPLLWKLWRKAGAFGFNNNCGVYCF